MSLVSKRRAPSHALVHFLRSQSDALCLQEGHLPYHVIVRPSASTKSQRRGIRTTSNQQANGLRSHLEDIWSRNRDACKALPPPRLHPAQIALRRRPASTDTSPSKQNRSWWSSIWTRRRGSPERSNHYGSSADLNGNHSGTYEDTSASVFNLSRTLARNASGSDMKLRCTEFDASGSVTLVSGEFKKTELIAKYGLLPRDLRKIDSSVLPHILVRPSAILLNLLHLRVLIQSDRVLVFDAFGSTDSYTQSLFMYDLEGKLRQKTDPKHSSGYLPYEFRALEAVLISVTSGLEAEFALVRDPVIHILRELEEDITREKLRHLLVHSRRLGTFEQKARLVRDALNELLEADDDLAAMYLTERKKTGKPRAENDHQDVEMLLESYHKICDEIVEISGNLISNIRTTEEVLRAILDANRNQLMLFEIKVSIATLGLAGGTLIAGFYGMNLENFIEETNYGFGSVTMFSVALSAFISVYGIRRLRKLQKVRMLGEGLDVLNQRPISLAGLHRGNWRADAAEAHAQVLRESAGRLGSTNGGTKGIPASCYGPVLWPGMDGLGMHKMGAADAMRSDTHSYTQDTNSDADDSSGPVRSALAKSASSSPSSSTSATVANTTFSGQHVFTVKDEPVTTPQDKPKGKR